MDKIVREIFELGKMAQKSLSAKEEEELAEEAYEVWNKFISDQMENVDKFYGYKDISEVSDSLPEVRIRAYNARQYDRRIGARAMLSMMRELKD